VGGNREQADLETAETLDSVYLHEALEALLEVGDSAVLYAGTTEPEGDRVREAFVRATVEARRISACRRSVLYAAFAAEAFINSFIAATLRKRDRKLIDRNRTTQKYILGPRLALPNTDLTELEERDELAIIDRLFTLRNRLVHPRPRELEEIKTRAAKWRFDEYVPSKAAEYVTAVGSEAYTLGQFHDAVPISTTAYLVVLGKEKILEFGQAADAVPERGTAAALTMNELERMMREGFGI
jgi:hypothetical protein